MKQGLRIIRLTRNGPSQVETSRVVVADEGRSRPGCLSHISMPGKNGFKCKTAAYRDLDA